MNAWTMYATLHWVIFLCCLLTSLSSPALSRTVTTLSLVRPTAQRRRAPPAGQYRGDLRRQPAPRLPDMAAHCRLREIAQHHAPLRRRHPNLPLPTHRPAQYCSSLTPLIFTPTTDWVATPGSKFCFAISAKRPETKASPADVPQWDLGRESLFMAYYFRSGSLHSYGSPALYRYPNLLVVFVLCPLSLFFLSLCVG